MNESLPGAFNSTLKVTESSLWIILAVLGVIFLIMSVVFEYHWVRYGLRSRRFIMAEFSYFTISVALFSLAVIAIESF